VVIRVEGGHDGSVPAALYREEKINWAPTGATAETNFDLDQMSFWAFKCAERAAVMTAWWPESYFYDVYVTPDSSPAVVETSTLNPIPPTNTACAFTAVESTPTYLPIAYLGKNPGSDSAPHGEFMTAYTLDGKPSREKAIWIDAGDVLAVSVLNPFENALSLIFDAVEDSGVIVDVESTNVSLANPAPLTVTFDRSGYYMPLILADPPAATEPRELKPRKMKLADYRAHRNVTAGEYTAVAVVFNSFSLSRAAAASAAATEPLLRHLTLPDWQTICHSVNEIMVYAASFRYTNTSKLINKEGSWVAKDSRGKSWWVWQNSFNKLATASQMKDSGLEEGFHGWVKPNNSNTEFVFRKFTSTLGGVILDTYAPVYDPEMPCVVMIAQVTDNAVQSAYAVAAWGVNYTTDSQWFTPRKSNFTHSEFETIMTVIEAIPTCHTNPTHAAQISKSVAKTTNSLLSNVSSVAPEALQIMELVSAFI